MAEGCIPLPNPVLPSFPDQINLIPTLPKATLSTPGLCCLQPLPPIIKLSVPLPPGTVNTGIGTALKNAGKAARAVLAQLQPKCPRQ